jgi:hypothetical protein
VLAVLKENREVNKAIRSQIEQVKKVKLLAKEFASRVLKLKFSLAEIQLFLLANKQLPGRAVTNVD